MRIIYKIKSSWDFISSQILTYLKRRWNSKMAISIKNHEDRITALENRKLKFTKVRLWHKANPGHSGDHMIELNESYMNYDLLLFEIEYFGWIQVMGLTSVMIQTTDLVHIYNLWDPEGANYVKVQPKSDYTGFQEKSIGLSSVNQIWGLKLYYNFSYNITREFYKVKFKLRHYLCSHLQKFI